ncbi:hypothetical protein QKY98_05695 [Pseudomonas sp. HR1]|uniref:DUF7696 family protein n=1 Tax=Pseudomonas sp. HR1 TaxID=1463361 RepID=UPI002542B18D|nr:hypothetical protein [Pseudomonas sp. HR1]MDK4198611.1 hypothetical protein [Pseudomonas sp. HR1]
MTIDNRQQLLEAEARTWIRKGYISPERIQELSALISSKRGAQAADKLIQEMRRQYGRRKEWLEQ